MSDLYAVYMLTNKNHAVLYIGVTNNLKRRVYEHRVYIGSSFTTRYNVNKLVYYEALEDVWVAIQREKTLKNLVRRKKILLIETKNPQWLDLYEAL